MKASTANCCTAEELHPDHSKHLHRINRIVGQLEGVKRMIEERRYCPDILTQTKAVAAALTALEGSILQTHLQSCVQETFKSGKQQEREDKIGELVEIFRRYQR